VRDRVLAGSGATRSSRPCAPVAIATETVLVVDTSAVLDALAGADAPSGLIERLADDGDLHAPHLIDVEILHALRRLSLTGAMSDDRAADVRADFAELALVRYPHHDLADRIWQLRHNLTAYDAAFVALAEALAAPLVTCDARLAAASTHAVEIELFARDG
jgi:predicted nucleic acid-binding protein